jgi:hypothetical protein
MRIAPKAAFRLFVFLIVEVNSALSMSPNRLLILLAIILLFGCSDDQGDKQAADLPLASLPGVYAGVFPCEDCPGIASTLWLRSDGGFFFRQRYAADDESEAMDAYSLGRWSSIADHRTIELRGEGPARIFSRLDKDTLIMRTDSDLEHRLTRDARAPEFSATIRLLGTIRRQGDSMLFTECLSGLVAPVSKGGDFTRFRHQYRIARRSSDPALVEFEGRFSWSEDGTVKALTIERFITVKASGGC